MLMRKMQRRMEIQGKVFLDTNCNGTKDEGEEGLKGVKINLFTHRKLESKFIQGNRNGLTLYRQDLIKSVYTDENGVYRFIVNEGRYILSPDVETIPRGKGLTVKETKIEGIPSKSIDFAVRDVAAIDINNYQSEFQPGEDISLHPVIMDREGNFLIGKVDQKFDYGINNQTGRYGSVKNQLLYKSIGVITSAGEISKKTAVRCKLPDMNTMHRIRSAYESKIIDEKTKILYYLHSLFSQSRLPAEYTSAVPVKSGSTAIKEIQDYILRSNADRAVVELARKYIASAVPALDKAYESPGGYFKIHYTTSGSNAVTSEDLNRNGIPDYIESIGAAFDRVRLVTCVSRGFRAPVMDKGASTFDIYVYDLKGKYGITFPLSYYTSPKNVRTASGFISIDNTYSGKKGFKKSRDDCMKVTAAHEFFHVVQYAYNADADTWWKEASATWNEDELYDGVNDYFQYLDEVFSSPQKPLEKNSYGGVVFAKGLSENLGGHSIIKRIWEAHSTGSSSLDAIDGTVRKSYINEDIGSVFKRYATYNYNPSQYYREGTMWTPEIAFQNKYDSYPIEEKTVRLEHLAAVYQLFQVENSESSKVLKLTIRGEDKIRWGFTIQRRRQADNVCEISEISVKDIGQRGSIVCEGLGNTYKEICLIVTNLEKSLNSAQYTYWASVE